MASGAHAPDADTVPLTQRGDRAWDMGRILSARDLRHERPVAIKKLTNGDEQRFEREALITAALQHPAIVPVYAAGRWPNGSPFYAMKLVDESHIASKFGRFTISK